MAARENGESEAEWFEVAQWDFPMCKPKLILLQNCAKDHADPKQECMLFEKHSKFCILQTFCPREGSVFEDCVEHETRKNFGEFDFARVPKKCQKKWETFDKCLTKKTADKN